MSTVDNVINQLAVELANKTINGAYDKAERDEALAGLKNIKLGFEEMNRILQSDERLKNLYEEVKAKQIEKEEQ